jgi:hypothetical protein
MSITIRDAQREVRDVYQGGLIGQLVSGLLWLVSAALATWVSGQAGFFSLALGGMLIFPLTQLFLTLTGKRASLATGNPMRWLAMQTAFIIPLSLPVILAAASANPNFFYPAFMVVVGVHYLPFIFLYGMPLFGVLAALLIGGGTALMMLLPGEFALGAWLTGAALVVFAFLLWASWKREAAARDRT